MKDLMYGRSMSEKQQKQARTWSDGRRLRAWELAQAGWQQKNIAAALGVSEGAVSQWLKRAREEGPQALEQRRPGSGRKARLSQAQLERLPEILARGAVHYGFTGEVWTRSRVARVIQQTFGVQYTPRHVGRLLQQIQWTPQKPVTRATQRDEAAIARFSEERWEELEKKPSAKDAPSSS